jgi:AcrR family transcriptional regulator
MALLETLPNPIPELPRPASQQDRRNRILDAAERCFARTGFHRATMQDVAAECAMSPGNIYRYFASKDDIVAGMAERDRERFRQDMTRLQETQDPRTTFEALGRFHLVEEPREKAVMMMEIWAEAARNPRIGDICRMMDTEVLSIMAAFIEHWREIEGIKAARPASEVAVLMLILSDGIWRRRALSSDFDAGAAFALIYPIVLQAIGVPLNPGAL